MRSLPTVKFLFIAFFIVLSLSAAAFAAQVDYSDSPREVVIQMGAVPSQDIQVESLTAVPDFTLYGDGRVIYAKADDERVKYLYESRLDPDQIRKLLEFVENEGFYDFNENFLNISAENLETTYITVKTKAGAKTIKIYGFGVAAHNGLLPEGLVKIYNKLSRTGAASDVEYNPERIVLYVCEYKQNLPDKAKVEKWNVDKIDLSDFAGEENSLTVKFNEKVFDGKPKDKIIKRLKGKTLFGNKPAYIKTFFKQGKSVYKVGYKPILPYDSASEIGR